jgi:hypothetical protein
VRETARTLILLSKGLEVQRVELVAEPLRETTIRL